jgi:hypothetical protein
VPNQMSLLSDKEIEIIHTMQDYLCQLAEQVVAIDIDQTLSISVMLIHLKLIGNELLANQNNPNYWSVAQKSPSYVVECWISDCNQEIGYATAELTQAA